MKALGVVRVSSKAQAEDDRYSLGNQREQIALYCQSRSWQLVRTLDYVQSGGSNQRELREILEIAARDAVGVVVVYELDRLSRNLVSTLLFIDALRAAGIRFAAVANEIDLTTPEGELQLHLLSAFAHYFRRQLARKVRGGQRLRAREGKVFGRAKFGYRIGADGRLVIDAQEAAAVRAAYRWYLDEGAGLREIARRLNAMGVRTKTGGAWGTSSARLLFRDVETYAGKVTYGKWRKEPSQGVWPRIVRNPDAYLVVDGAHPAILSPDIIAEALRQRAVRARQNPRAASNAAHLLTGLLRCGHCGARMVHSSSGRHTYYICGGYARHGTCRRNSVRAPAVERAVIDDLLRMAEGLIDEAAVRRQLDAATGRRALAQERDRVQRRLADFPAILLRAEQALLEGAFTTAQYRAARTRVEGLRRELEASLARLPSQPDADLDPARLAADLRARVAARCLDRSDAGTRVFLQRHIERAVYTGHQDGGDLEIVYAC